MDSITHLTQKILVERARQNLAPIDSDQIPSTAPPPYTASEDSDSDSDSDSDDETDDSSPVTLTLNATTSIHGSGNLVPTSPSPLADATKFSALLLHAVNRINASAGTAGQRRRRRRRRINVDLTINCGVSIVGDRNVVGSVGVKAKAPEPAIAGASAVAGAKRKAEADEISDEVPRSKRRAESGA